MAMAMREQLPLAQAETECACFLLWPRFGSRAEQGLMTLSQDRVAGVCKHEGCFSPATTCSPADGGVLCSPRHQDSQAVWCFNDTEVRVPPPWQWWEELCQKELLPSEAFAGIPGTEKSCSSPSTYTKTRLLRLGSEFREPVTEAKEQSAQSPVRTAALPLNRSEIIKSSDLPSRSGI